MTPDAHGPWAALEQEVRSELLDLPLDGLLDLLARDLALTVTWLLPARLLLELSGAPAVRGPLLLRAGWTAGQAGGWRRPSPAVTRGAAAAAAAGAATTTLRLLGVDPGDVELWRPRCPDECPDEVEAVPARWPAWTEPLW